MNFSSPSQVFGSPLGLFPGLDSEFSRAISNEEFKSFHSIDRNLYSLLVQILGKVPSDSMKVMGFWLFLEHEGCKSSGLVRTLLRWPLNSINEVFNESLLCLRHMQDGSLNVEKSDDEELFFLSRLLKKSVSKMHFVENGCIILSRVEDKVNRICIRAFEDIPHNPSSREMISPNYGVSNENGFTNLSNGTRVFVPTRTGSTGYPKNGTGVFVPTLPTSKVIPSNISPFLPQRYQSQVVGDLKIGSRGTGYFCTTKAKIGYPNESSSQHDLSMNENSGEMIEEKQVEEVMAVDRTIFLTFSKGYPLTESEVRDFFTRRFGDFIETIEMQEVENGEQPLFAKIVSKSIEMVDVIVAGGRAKYYINKKHVFARKFMLPHETK